MSYNPYQVVRDFEKAVAEYGGSKYCVTVTSCTAALFLCCKYLKVKDVELPRFTYVSVGMSVLHAGGRVLFRDERWSGAYQLRPYPIWDSARRFTRSMHHAGRFTCCSFHWSKHLGLGQGGCILHDDKLADVWFRKARFDGRTEGVEPKEDKFDMLGWHFYMSPETAAHGLVKMQFMADHNNDLPNSDYADLSRMEIFK